MEMFYDATQSNLPARQQAALKKLVHSISTTCCKEKELFFLNTLYMEYADITKAYFVTDSFSYKEWAVYCGFTMAQWVLYFVNT